MILIGLSGKMQTGKDTVADYLVDKYKFVKLSWADKLKSIAMDLWGLTYDECYVNKTERSRMIMQKLGTEVIRSIEENTWVNYLMREIRKKGYSRVVIPDTRFPNEVEAIKKVGGKIWRVERYDTKPTGDVNHPSEIALDDYKHFDLTIANNFDIQHLHQLIDLAIQDSFPEIFKNA